MDIFNGRFSRKPSYADTKMVKQEMMWWLWHQLEHMQIICTSLQTDNHAITSMFTGWMLFLTLNQQHQRTEGR